MANKNSARELLISISKNIGIEDVEFLNAIPDEVEVPENFNELFHKNYLTISSAKNNTDLDAFYRRKIFGTVESNLKAYFKANQMDDVYKPLEDEEDTIARLKKALDVVKTSNKGTGDKEVEKQLKSEISRLNSEIKLKDEGFSAKENELNSKWESKFFGLSVNDKLAKKQFSETYEADDIRFLVQQKINDLPYVYKRNDKDGFDVYHKETPEIIAHKDGKPLTFDSIIDEVADKYTKKSTTTQTPPPNRVEIEPTKNQLTSTVMGSPDYGK